MVTDEQRHKFEYKIAQLQRMNHWRVIERDDEAPAVILYHEQPGYRGAIGGRYAQRGVLRGWQKVSLAPDGALARSRTYRTPITLADDIV